MGGEFITVTTTTDKKEEAEAIAKGLVERGLAACAQVAGPIESTYRWKGKVETAEEWVCAAKTTAEKYEAVEKAIRGMHSYEVPEIVAVPIVRGSKAYLDWLGEAVK